MFIVKYIIICLLSKLHIVVLCISTTIKLNFVINLISPSRIFVVNGGDIKFNLACSVFTRQAYINLGTYEIALDLLAVRIRCCAS